LILALKNIFIENTRLQSRYQYKLPNKIEIYFLAFTEVCFFDDGASLRDKSIKNKPLSGHVFKILL
jgi:hypothetical protein